MILFVSVSSLFGVKPTTGEVTVLANANQITERSYVLVVSAQDSGRPPRRATAVVNATFSNFTAPVTKASVASGEMDLIPLIILAALCGLLLLIIILLVIYIQRK